MDMSRALDRTEPVFDAVSADGDAAAFTPNATFFRQPLAPILTAVGMTVLVVMAISFARTNGLVAALWGAGGLAAAVWLRGGRGLTYDLGFGALVTMGILAGEFLVGNGPALSAMFTMMNLLEIGLAVVLTRRFVPGLSINSVEGLARFLGVCAVAPIPAALVSALALNAMVGSDILDGFRIWWCGHALGFAVVGAFGLALQKRHLAIVRQPARLAEGFALLGLIATACYAIFSHLSLPYGFLLMPLLLLMAVRFRVSGIAAALVLVTVMALGGTMAGHGPYHSFEAEDRALLAQLLVLLGYMPILMVAALLEERDRLGERARAGRERAERASAAKSRLLANVAHEIKSPVGGIIGIGELWAGGQLGATSADQIEMAQMLVKTARQVETLAHDLLDVARAESGAVKVELRPTDVAGLLEDVRRALILKPETRGIAVETLIEGDALIVLADSQRLAQVIGNLASNAVKYGASGGRVHLKASWSHDRVRIEVVDFGPGLTPKSRPNCSNRSTAWGWSVRPSRATASAWPWPSA